MLFRSMRPSAVGFAGSGADSSGSWLLRVLPYEATADGAAYIVMHCSLTAKASKSDAKNSPNYTRADAEAQREGKYSSIWGFFVCFSLRLGASAG